MDYWNGTAWVEKRPARRPEARPADRAATAVMLLAAFVMLIPILGTSAASRRGSAAGCEVNPSSADVGEMYVVRAWGLPTRTALNLWTTAEGVTTGEPIGGTTDGTFTLDRSSDTAGVTTYAFSGPTGKGMKVYARCSVSAY